MKNNLFNYKKYFLLVLFVCTLLLIFLNVFWPKLLISNPIIARLNYINNHPQKNVGHSEEKLYLGDHGVIKVGIFNNSFSFSNPEIIIKAPNSGLIDKKASYDYASQEWNSLPSMPRKIENGTFLIEAFRMYPLQYKTISLPMYFYSTGSFIISAEVKESKEIFRSENVIAVLPLPQSEKPVAPSMIVSYLGDMARRICDEKYPCLELDTLGNCIKVHSDNNQCLIDENRRLFSGCEDYENDYKTTNLNRWYKCLMMKHGIPISVTD